MVRGANLAKPIAHKGASRPVLGLAPWERLRSLAFSAMVAVLLLGALHIGGLTLRTLAETPVREVKINGDLRFLDEARLDAVVRPHLAQGFFMLDLQTLRADLEALPWVQEAAVRRRWPDSVQILITEHVPALRWGEAALLNPIGETFQPQSVADFGHLPVLYGPVGSEHMVLDQFDALMARLAPRGYTVGSLKLDGKHSWSLVLTDGLEIVLGRRDLERRAQRLVALLDRRDDLGVASEGVLDLRYSNGFAIAPSTVIAGLEGKQSSKGESG